MLVEESKYWSASQLLAQKPVVAKTLPVGQVVQEVDAVHVEQVSLQAAKAGERRDHMDEFYGVRLKCRHTGTDWPCVQ